MTAAEPAWTGRLPAGLPDGVTAEIKRFVEQVPADASCVVTGSIIEGLGNKNSDIDLYVIHDTGNATTRPVSIGIRDSRFVDCEFLGVQGLARLAERFARARETRADLAGFALRDFDRYYRLAVAVRIRVTEQAGPVLDNCRVDHSCRLFAAWSLLRAAEHLARARTALALGERWRAVMLLRETAYWRATSVLARAGEGYPKLKWTVVKADRRFGRDSAEYRSCLRGLWTVPEEAEAELEWLAERVVLPEALRSAPDGPGWTLAEEVTVVPDGDVRHLVRGRKSLAAVTGLTARVVTALDGGHAWPEAVAEAAAELKVGTEDVIESARAELRRLADGGYLVSTAGEEDGDA